MIIPNLPTDSLYKFIALTGILLLVISVIYPELKQQELNNDIVLLNGEIKKLNYEIRKYKGTTKIIEKKIKELDSKCNCGANSFINDSLVVRTRVTGGPKELVELSKEIDNLIDEWYLIQDDLSTLSINVETNSELIDLKQSEINYYKTAIEYYSPLFVLLALFGFTLWFFKIQQYQDKILFEQFRSLTKFEFCQSCGVRLSNDSYFLSLSEKQKKNTRYCGNCFKNGEFVEPEITYKEMKAKIKSQCKKLGLNKFQTFIVLIHTRNLDRWIKKYKW